LILVGAGLSGFEWADWVQPEPEIEAQAAFEAGDYEKAAEIEAEMWVAGVGRTAADVDQAVLDKVREMNLVALRYEALKLRETQYLDPPAFPRLGEIRVPTLVIVGENDWPDIFAIADALTEKISGAQKIIMPGTAHVPNMEKPAEFNQHVRTFLNGLNPA
jgi:pimeloyl-ACP methyl ester carboxylesterase